jgi:multiple antibiotic resistance protein
MIENVIAAFIIYFVVIDPISNAPVFLTSTGAHDHGRKTFTALEGTLVATTIMLFFAVCGAWILAYPNIPDVAFKIAGGIILFLVALGMLVAKN